MLSRWFRWGVLGWMEGAERPESNLRRGADRQGMLRRGVARTRNASGSIPVRVQFALSQPTPPHPQRCPATDRASSKCGVKSGDCLSLTHHSAIKLASYPSVQVSPGALPPVSTRSHSFSFPDYASSGLRVGRSGKRLKSRSAVHSSVTPWLIHIAAILAS